MSKQVTKSVQLNSGIHAKLKEVSDKRRAEGRQDYTMSAMIAKFALALHKKEMKS